MRRWYELTRSGSLTKPKPLVAFDCGSQSTSRVFTSAAANDAAKLMAVVVLPTPPFWLATAIIFPMSCAAETDESSRMRGAKARPDFGAIYKMFHEEHFSRCKLFHEEHCGKLASWMLDW